MKNQQKLKARELYFTAEHTNTEIAAQVGVNRRTIMLWAKEGDWQKQRDLDQQLFALLTERSYLLADSFTSSLLSMPAASIDLRHVKTIHYLATGISRLKGKPAPVKRKEIFSVFIKKAGSTKASNRPAA